MTSDELSAPEVSEPAPSELFHENSKHRGSDPRIAERIIAATLNPTLVRMASARKTYPSVARIALPRSWPPAILDFDRSVESRRSRRDFQPLAIDAVSVAKLLHFASGVTGSVTTADGYRQRFRAAPSGGALYPVEAYLVALNVKGVPPGVYKYDPVEHDLAEVLRGEFGKDLETATYTEEIRHVPAIIALTGISLKSRIKYGERGYRFMLLEAGHIAQNVLLTATSMNLIALPIGGFVDDQIDRLLNIDGVDEVSLYLIAVGHGNEHQERHAGTEP